MEAPQAIWRTEHLQNAAAAGDYGTLLRAARVAHHLTLEQAGALVGYSAATLSRLETGRRPLTDVTVLRRLADALSIPPEMFGLIPTGAAAPPQPGPDPRVGRRAREGGDGPVRRRELLTGMLGAALTSQSLAARADGALAEPLHDVLLDQVPSGPGAATAASVSSQLAAAKSDFAACRLQRLAGRLPGLIQAATTHRDATGPDQRCAAEGLLAATYLQASRLLIKVHDDGPAWATTDRALQAARAAADPLLEAEAMRLTATVLRRTDHRHRAGGVLTAAAVRLDADTGIPDRRHLAAYTNLLCTAAYTAALQHRRHDADALLGEASDAARRLGTAASAELALYRLSVARVLGDHAAALDHARQVRPAQLRDVERRTRYHQDLALAQHGCGRHTEAYQTLQTVAHASPDEIRHRDWTQTLTRSLLNNDRRRDLPGLRAFATRAGVVT